MVCGGTDFFGGGGVKHVGVVEDEVSVAGGIEVGELGSCDGGD